jgi:putative tricarboxylic transport membrane protein
MISKRVFLSSIAAVCCGLEPARSAATETYPSHPITVVLPFSAGGPTDALARIITAKMQELLGQSVIIENVTGAAGTIGVGRVARARGGRIYDQCRADELARADRCRLQSAVRLAQ